MYEKYGKIYTMCKILQDRILKITTFRVMKKYLLIYTEDNGCGPLSTEFERFLTEQEMFDKAKQIHDGSFCEVVFMGKITEERAIKPKEVVKSWEIVQVY